MSVYTTQLRWVIESCTDENKSLSDRVTDAVSQLFGAFPIYDESHRIELLRKILLHYINYEIGYETVALWKLKMTEHLNLIMPFYNQMYATLDNNYNFLINADYTETTSGEQAENETVSGKQEQTNTANETGSGNIGKTANQTTNQTDNTNGENLLSDLPQINYDDVDYGTELTKTEAHSSSNVIKNDSETSTHSVQNNKTGTTNTESTKTTTAGKTHETHKTINGLQGTSRAKLLKEWREQIINVDEQIVNSCKSLFMLIW